MTFCSLICSSIHCGYTCDKSSVHYPRIACFYTSQNLYCSCLSELSKVTRFAQSHLVVIRSTRNLNIRWLQVILFLLNVIEKVQKARWIEFLWRLNYVYVVSSIYVYNKYTYTYIVSPEHWFSTGEWTDWKSTFGTTTMITVCLVAIRHSMTTLELQQWIFDPFIILS